MLTNPRTTIIAAAVCVALFASPAVALPSQPGDDASRVAATVPSDGVEQDTPASSGLPAFTTGSSKDTAVEPTGAEGESAANASTQAPASDITSASWERLWGSSQFDTMADVAQAGWTSSDAVVVATSANYYDALTASPLAGYLKAPVLLTEKNRLTPQTASEIKRLGAQTVYIVGGRSVVSAGVEQQIAALGIARVERIWGQRAQDTAVQVAEFLAGKHSSTAIVATDSSFQDALSIAPYAYKSASPIFLSESRGGNLSSGTQAALSSGGYRSALVVGGPSAVKETVVSKIKEAGISSVTRLWGQNAEGTSSRVAQWCIDRGGMSARNVGVATSTRFYDALCGSALCGRNNAPILLARDGNRSVVYSFINPNRSKISHGYVFGGAKAVSTATVGLVQSGATKEAYRNFSGYDTTGFTKLGIDVSQWQGVIDWAKVKASGIDFAIVRVAHGVGTNGITDRYYARNLREAKAVGIELGVYIYSDATDVAGARSEGARVVSLLRAAGVSAADIPLGVYYDLEEEGMQKMSNRSLLLEMTKGFVATVTNGGYRTVGVYSNLYWWTTFLPSTEYNQWRRWMAQYNTTCSYVGAYRMWQFRPTGSVPGINGNVDMDFGYW